MNNIKKVAPPNSLILVTGRPPPKKNAPIFGNPHIRLVHHLVVEWATMLDRSHVTK